jgi:hypothetical protein
MVLPRQARDEHTENSTNKTPFEQGVRKDYYNPFGMFYNCSVAANTCLYLRANHNLLGAANRPSLVSLTAARKYVDGLHATLRAAAVRKRVFLRHLCIKLIIVPRQARDKHRESTQKRIMRFCRHSLSRGYSQRKRWTPPSRW